VKQAIIGLLAIGMFIVASLVAPKLSYAVYGGDANGYQQESREDDYWGFTCGSYNNNCFGRCGPGCSTYFGTTVTTACQNHDACIRDYRCAGYSGANAHYYCLTGNRGLGKAAGSLISYHWNNAKTWVKDTWQSTWARVGS
jgi:hypothetical protein